jgi:hypothetical protein
MSRSILALGGLVGALILASLGPLGAAELLAPTRERAGPVRGPDCGPCGCLGVTYVYHRELRSTYGLSYDPRNYDTTQPRYYFGRMHAYPRYFVDGWGYPGPC